MKVAELQGLIEKIKAQCTVGDSSTQSMDLFAPINRILDPLNPETELTHHILEAPFLKITDELYEELTKDQSLLTELLALIIKCSRLIGYAEVKTLNTYPQFTLIDTISKKRPQEKEKLGNIIFFLRMAFYLIQKHCSPEQLVLMPFLIYFRRSTTDEERRSELAIFNWLFHQKAKCLTFFSQHEGYINMRSLQMIHSLSNLIKLIPTTYTQFIRKTQSYDLLWSLEQDNPISKNTLVDDTYELLEKKFFTQAQQDYNASLDFANSIKTQLPKEANNESFIVYLALYLFCLNQYKQLRHTDPNDRYSLISLSKQTKEDAVDKKQLELRGVPVQYSFFEGFAIKEGRLGKLIASFEEQSSYSHRLTSL